MLRTSLRFATGFRNRSFLITPLSSLSLTTQPKSLFHYQLPRFEQQTHDENKDNNTKNKFKSFLQQLSLLSSLVISVIAITLSNESRKRNMHNNSEQLTQEVRDALARPFEPTTAMIPGMDLCAKEGAQVLKELCRPDCVPSLSYVGGPSNCGKSISVEIELRGRKNVLYIALRNQSPTSSLAGSLGISKRSRDEKEVTLSQMMESLKQVLKEIKIQRVTTPDTALPLVILSDFMQGNEDCKIIAGYMLQFVEEQLASGIHISSNHSTFTDLRKLSGHAARLSKYTISYTKQEDLDRYHICKNEHVRKLGGHMGQIFFFLKKIVPLLEEECGSISLRSNDAKIASFVNGEIILPDEKIAEVIDVMIKTESDEIKGTLKQVTNITSSWEVLRNLQKSQPQKIKPTTREEIRVCEELTQKNILTNVFDDTDYYTWYRPVLRYAFETITTFDTLIGE